MATKPLALTKNPRLLENSNPLLNGCSIDKLHFHDKIAHRTQVLNTSAAVRVMERPRGGPSWVGVSLLPTPILRARSQPPSRVWVTRWQARPGEKGVSERTGFRCGGCASRRRGKAAAGVALDRWKPTGPRRGGCAHNLHPVHPGAPGGSRRPVGTRTEYKTGPPVRAAPRGDHRLSVSTRSSRRRSTSGIPPR